MLVNAQVVLRETLNAVYKELQEEYSPADYCSGCLVVKKEVGTLCKECDASIVAWLTATAEEYDAEQRARKTHENYLAGLGLY